MDGSPTVVDWTKFDAPKVAVQASPDTIATSFDETPSPITLPPPDVDAASSAADKPRRTGFGIATLVAWLSLVIVASNAVTVLRNTPVRVTTPTITDINPFVRPFLMRHRCEASVMGCEAASIEQPETSQPSGPDSPIEKLWKRVKAPFLTASGFFSLAVHVFRPLLFFASALLTDRSLACCVRRRHSAMWT